MTHEEKAENDRFLVRYQLNDKERSLYESAYRQCLRCEAPANEFRAAEEEDLARAAGQWSRRSALRLRWNPITSLFTRQSAFFPQCCFAYPSLASAIIH